MKPGVHRLKEPADRLLARFRAATLEDKAIERTVRRLGVLSISCGVAAVASFFVLDRLGIPLAARTAGVVLAGLGVVLGLRWNAGRRLDLDDRKLQTVQRVLGILRADIPRSVSVALTIDLRAFDRGGQVIFKDGPVTRYRHAWLELTAGLADGTVVTLGLTDRVKRKVKRRGAREQWRSDLDVGLRPAPGYGEVAEAARRLRERPAPPALRLVALREASVGARGARRLWARLRTPVTAGAPAQLAGGDAMLSALRWVYGGLAPARRSG